MRIFRFSGGVSPDGLPGDARGAVVALGNFDGVHQGHRGVIAMAEAIAGSLGVPCGVVTFEPHPRSVFRPDDPPFRLSPSDVKIRLLEGIGVDLLHVLSFDEVLRAKPAEDFVRQDLVAGLAVRHVVFGHDFAFGRGRAGNAALLEGLGAELGFGVTAVPPITCGGIRGGELFSSTAVREALAGGRPRDAARLLGRPFEIEGVVSRGDQRGRTVGFPTANIGLGEYQRPLFGVYAVRARLGADPSCDDPSGHEPSGAWFDAVANLGTRPTVDGVEARLETHIFDFDRDIYDRVLRVQLIDFLRPERRFPDFQTLVGQITADAERARMVLAAEPKAVLVAEQRGA